MNEYIMGYRDDIVQARQVIRESVDSVCRDGANMPIVRICTKAF